jgi:hypothetical protein
MVSATTTWLAAFVTCPAPLSPTRTIVCPIASKRGRALSKSSALPPTMIESVPCCAPTSPPETGASSMFALICFTSAANSSVTTGEIVLMSTSSEPSLMPSSTPFSPITTSLRSGESRKHGDDDVAALGDLPGAAGGGAVLRQLVDRSPATVVEHEVVARLHNIARHRLAHDPEPHEPYSLCHDSA